MFILETLEVPVNSCDADTSDIPGHRKAQKCLPGNWKLWFISTGSEVASQLSRPGALPIKPQLEACFQGGAHPPTTYTWSQI